MNLYRKIKSLLSGERMIVVGNNEDGWHARYTNDPNSIWSMKKDNAIAACEERYQEFLAGKLWRGTNRYWSTPR